MTTFDDIRTGLAEVEADVQLTFDQKDQTIASLNATVAKVTADFAEYRRLHPDTTPVPVPEPPKPAPTGKSKVGVCIAGGDTAASTMKEWPGASLREFDGGKGTAFVFDIPTTVNGFHGSSKLGALPTDAQFIKLFDRKTWKDGMIWTPNHEHDVKHKQAVKDGDPQAEAKRAATQVINEACYDAVVRLRSASSIPKILVANTISAYRFVDGTFGKYMHRADLLAVDMDGMNDRRGSSSYYDWAALVPKITAVLAKYGYSGWSIGEIGEPRLDNDKDGTKRVAWIKKSMPIILAAEPAPLAVMWFNNASKTEWRGYELTLPNEQVAWESFIGA